MGWWWSNKDPTRTVAPTQKPLATSAQVSQQEQPAPQPGNISPLDDSQSRKPLLTREEESAQELISWLKEIQSEGEDRKSSTSKSQSLTSGLSPEDITPDSLYPTQISCRSAFDYAFFCQSFGGQFVNIYRYSTFRSCANHWEDFWLCMRTRNWDEKDRKKAIQDHYRQKAVKYKMGPSSEDVWEVRIEPARDAFQGNLEELERQIEEWKKANPHAEAPWEANV